MEKLQIFKEKQFGNVRVIIRDGEPWFVVKDVCDILGIANSRDAIAKLRDKQKADVGITDTSSNGVEQSRSYSIVSEGGLYALIMKSRKPEAEAFQDWVTEEVIPSIRKTGSYSMTPKDYIAALRALADAEEEKERLAFERDEARRTKAHFVEGRDAEMCGRVGGLTNANERLREQLGDAKNWKQVKAIPWIREYFNVTRSLYSVLGKKLCALSLELGAEIREVEDSQFGHVKAYSIHVINALRAQLDRNPQMLASYRV